MKPGVSFTAATVNGLPCARSTCFSARTFSPKLSSFTLKHPAKSFCPPAPVTVMVNDACSPQR